MNAVIVENEFITQMHLEHLFEQMDVSVVGSASNYNEAIELIQTFNPDFVLLDINLEGEKTGIDVANFIRSKTQSKIIFITGNFEDSLMLEMNQFRPLGIISKPFENQEFKTEILRMTGLVN